MRICCWWNLLYINTSCMEPTYQMFQVFKTQRSLLDAPKIRQPPRRHLQGGMTGAQQQLLSLCNPLTTCVDGQHKLRHLKKDRQSVTLNWAWGGATPIGTLRENLESWSIFWFSLISILSIINELVRERTSWVFRKPKATCLDSFGIEFMWQTMAQSTVASPNFDRSQPPVVAKKPQKWLTFAALQHQSRPWHFHTFPRNGLW